MITQGVPNYVAVCRSKDIVFNSNISTN